MAVNGLSSNTGETLYGGIIGGAIAVCTILVLAILGIVCCLFQGKKKRSFTPQERKASTNAAILENEEPGNAETIRSVQFSPNPAYESARQTELQYYSELLEENEADARYVTIEKENLGSDFEYLHPEDIETEIQSVSSPKQSVPNSPLVDAWKPEQHRSFNKQDDKNNSDEDEEGYITYNPEKTPIDLVSFPQDTQIYENTIRSGQSMSERHGYVNDGQVDLEASTDDPLQRSDSYCYVDDLDRLVKHIQAVAEDEKQRSDSHSYVNDLESLVKEAKCAEEEAELDQSVYVNNLDEIVKAAKAKQVNKSLEVGSQINGSKQDDSQNTYMNEIFDAVQKALHEEKTSSEDNQDLSESLYVNDLPHLYSSSYKK